MTTDPALANLHCRDDRLAEIEGMFEQGHWDEDWARGDIEWLIAEVKRLRVKFATAERIIGPHIADHWHNSHECPRCKLNDAIASLTFLPASRPDDLHPQP